MPDAVLEKLNEIEEMIRELSTKIDNFLGYEELTDKEKKEIEELRKDIKKGNYVSFDELFGEH
ncbi:hypothetical protein [Aciduliprofundum sp. MAR08-339]|uniref:hypothetical protein n=1 Tax=Aciduliprofundum sp. (strain MAR08-339) TaxID=673860 RepID=UPI00138A0B96